jgi:nitric oxide reductase subunit C
MQVGSRKLLIGSLVAAFFAQGALVYGDQTAAAAPPLSDLAQRGRAVWHEHNCAACHQIHGFGGFLGPDLTNAGSRLERQRVADVLRNGMPPMPPFPVSDADIDALLAYLVELDGYGIGQARLYQAPSATALRAALTQRIAAAPLDAAAAAGRALFDERCAFCHRPLAATPLGLFVAPDLSLATDRLDDAALDATIREGRLLRGMPPSGLDDAQRRNLIAWLRWLQRERKQLLALCGCDDEERALPWFEYR